MKIKFWWLSLMILLIGGGCATQLPVPIDDAPTVYQRAIVDAQTAESDEIVRDLTAIVPYNEALLWHDGKVRVVTWTSWDGYDSLVGQETILGREVWVTVVPELQDFCQTLDLGSNEKTLRLEQLLGLPPNNGKDRFIELWVDPADLFRPAPDPEITDHETELDFPVSRWLTVDKAYKSWFNDLRATSYGPEGYPWTRLGYTYDWGNPDDEVGLSEFVIRSGATVWVHSVSSLVDYCD